MKYSKIIFLISLLITCSRSAAQDFTKTVQCDVIVLEAAIDMIEKKCNNEKNELNMLECNSAAWEISNKHLCSEMAKKHAQNKLFFSEQRLILFKWFNERKISAQDYRKKSNEISNLISKENKEFHNAYNNQIKKYRVYTQNRIVELDAQLSFLRADRYNSNAIRDSIAILNGIPFQSNNSPKIHNYFINGIGITCTTVNNSTSCN